MNSTHSQKLFDKSMELLQIKRELQDEQLLKRTAEHERYNIEKKINEDEMKQISLRHKINMTTLRAKMNKEDEKTRINALDQKWEAYGVHPPKRVKRDTSKRVKREVAKAEPKLDKTVVIETVVKKVKTDKKTDRSKESEDFDSTDEETDDIEDFTNDEKNEETDDIEGFTSDEE